MANSQAFIEGFCDEDGFQSSTDARSVSDSVYASLPCTVDSAQVLDYLETVLKKHLVLKELNVVSDIDYSKIFNFT